MTTWPSWTGCSRKPRAGAVCLKTTLAYERSLRFEEVPRNRGCQGLEPSSEQ